MNKQLKLTTKNHLKAYWENYVYRYVIAEEATLLMEFNEKSKKFTPHQKRQLAVTLGRDYIKQQLNMNQDDRFTTLVN